MNKIYQLPLKILMWNSPFSYNITVFVYLSLDTVFIVRGKIMVTVCGNAFSDIIKFVPYIELWNMEWLWLYNWLVLKDEIEMSCSLPCNTNIQLRKLYFGWHNVTVQNYIHIFYILGALHQVPLKASFGILFPILPNMWCNNINSAVNTRMLC